MQAWVMHRNSLPALGRSQELPFSEDFKQYFVMDEPVCVRSHYKFALEYNETKYACFVHVAFMNVFVFVWKSSLPKQIHTHDHPKKWT
jgi:hypothetical protein